MTKDNITQGTSSTQLKIKGLLIQLKQTFGITFSEIAERVGVSNTYISSVFNDKRDGGSQLLAGLELLRELTILKKMGGGADPELMQELNQMKRRIGEIESRVIGQQNTESHPPKQRPEDFSFVPRQDKVALEAAKLAVKSAEQEPRDTPPKK